MPEASKPAELKDLFGKGSNKGGSSDQKVRSGVLIGILFVFIVPPILWVSAINDKFDKASLDQKARRTAWVQGTVVWVPTKKPAWYAGLLAHPSETPTEIPYLTATLRPTITPYPTFAATATPYPTYTPQPTQIVSFADGHQIYGLYYFMFSRYWPPLLGVNCHPDNVENGSCKDTTSSGRRWSEWQIGHAPKPYKGGVAVPMSYPLGIVVRVSWPPSIAGDYLAVDYCPACDDYPGVTFIDFISSEQVLSYWTPIKAEVLPSQ